MRKLAIVAAHFTPSNLASVHRARLWALHLEEFGWQPIIVTAHWRYYEETPDWELHSSIPPGLRVVRTRALPTRPLRLVGDLGVRALPWQYRTLCRLARDEQLDFVHITVPSHYSALLGRAVAARTAVPYGIDYIDPWLHRWPGVERRFSRHWLSHQLSRHLEPWAVKNASLITGVAPGYFEGALERNPELAGRVVTASMPYGISQRDFDCARRTADAGSMLYSRGDGAFNIVYAGALLPDAYGVLERFLAAVKQALSQAPEVMRRLRLHFIGTSRTMAGDATISDHAARAGLAGHVLEYPERMPYLTVLRHLGEASAILILGSNRPHYSPSKVYQAMMAQRPILALLHENSTAVNVLETCGAGPPIVFRDDRSLAVEQIADALTTLVRDGVSDAPAMNWDAFEQYTARASAEALARALDLAVDQAASRDRDNTRDRSTARV